MKTSAATTVRRDFLTRITVKYLAGTLSLEGLSPGMAARATGLTEAECRWDSRTTCFRAPAMSYTAIVQALQRAGLGFHDQTQATPDFGARADFFSPHRPYQQEAFEAWQNHQSRGVVVLPTGAGKTRVALCAIEQRQCASLVVAPTLDLVAQWQRVLQACFDVPVGMVGGGTYDVLPLTVSTYDSALHHAEHWGNRFGMLVFDECHHLPSPGFAQIAQMSTAPFRLGLSATPERADGGHQRLNALVGPVVYRKEVNELGGDWLAPYETERIYVDLSEAEAAEYQAARKTYLDFLRTEGIRLAQPSGWGRFLRATSQSPTGREAWLAYRTQKKLALGATAKQAKVKELLQHHARDKTLVFTNDNQMAYELSKRLLIPVITHQTLLRERSLILRGLAEGTFRAVATSRVLNEGVDLPDVNTAIVVSGTGSVREHVQRLGRLLRPSPNKTARLYELVAQQTHETRTSERRRAHVAYS